MKEHESMKMAILWAVLLCPVISIAQNRNTPLSNVPLALSKDEATATRYQDALINHPEKLGGKFDGSPTFVGGRCTATNIA